MPILPKSAYDIKIPKMVNVEQIFPDDKLDPAEIPTILDDRICSEEFKNRLHRGDKVAVLVGSRGISNLADVVKSTIDSLKKQGCEPFIVPAMGSHGGGIAEEQRKIIEGYGITEEAMGAPIKASMETVIIGETKSGVPVHIDKFADEADAIVPVVRVKVHTDFAGPIQSGFCKMLSIGIGKHNGCSRLHQEGFARFHDLIPEVGGIVIEKKNIPFGVAIIENAHEHVYTVEVVAGEKIKEREPELLALSKSLMPRLQFEKIDVLIVDQIGKDITGSGMDPNITGRRASGPIENFVGPEIGRIVVLGLSEGTHRNATGIGLADFITKDVFESYDPISTYANCIASGNPNAGKIPIIMENEEDAIRGAIQTCAGIDVNDAKIVRIKDTLHLVDIQVSENMLTLCENNPKFKI